MAGVAWYADEILEHERSQLPGNRQVTSVDVCKGSFHIYRAVGKLGASEGLRKLDHAAYGVLASQGSAGPVFALGSGSCLQNRNGDFIKTKLPNIFKLTTYVK